MATFTDVTPHNDTAHFPLLRGLVKHGFSWGKNAGNMSYTFSTDGLLSTLKRNQEFFDTVSLGVVKDAIILIPEHKTNIIDADEAFISEMKPRAKGWQVVGDAVFTQCTDQTFVVKPGDCTTAVLYAKDGKGKPVIGLVHSGWRSVDQGLPAKTINHLIDRYHVDPRTIIIGITPHILKENRTYEDLRDFTQTEKWKDFLDFDGLLYHFDEGGCALAQYIKSGVLEENIDFYEVDTYEAAIRGETFSQKLAVNREREGVEYQEGRFIVAVRL